MRICKEKDQDFEDEKPSINKKLKIVLLLAAVIIIAIFIIFVILNKEGKTTTVSKASLEKVVEINELSTVDYTYNATATKYADNKDNKVEYYVAYEGTVTAGINFNKLDFDINDDEKIVTIILPKIEIQSIRVDMGTMEYIFINKKRETESVSRESYKLCKDDLKNRVEKEELLYKMAKENAVDAVRALFGPWLEDRYKDYKLEIK